MEDIRYLVYNTSYMGHVAFPSEYLDTMLDCGYMLQTQLNKRAKPYMYGYELIDAQPFVNQSFHSITSAEMRKLLGEDHQEDQIYVCVKNYGMHVGVPKSMMSDLLPKCYLINNSRPIEDKEDQHLGVKLGTNWICEIQPLNSVCFDVFWLSDITACQAQGILSGS